MDKRPLYVAVAADCDGSDPQRHSMAALACAVVNPERAREVFYRELQPVGRYFDPLREDWLKARGISRDTRQQNGNDPEAVLVELADWLDVACWILYQPVFVPADELTEVFLRDYLARCRLEDPFDNPFNAAYSPEAIALLGGDFLDGLAKMVSYQKVDAVGRELSRRLAVRPAINA